MLSPPTVVRGGDTLEYGMSAREKEPILLVLVAEIPFWRETVSCFRP